jgi:hypothetical protein
MTTFNSIEECKKYLHSKKLKKGIFFKNEFKGEIYFTLEPTPFVEYDLLTGYQQKIKVNINCKKINFVNNCGKHFRNEHMKKTYINFKDR